MADSRELIDFSDGSIRSLIVEEGKGSPDETTGLLDKVETTPSAYAATELTSISVQTTPPPSPMRSNARLREALRDIPTSPSPSGISAAASSDAASSSPSDNKIDILKISPPLRDIKRRLKSNRTFEVSKEEVYDQYFPRLLTRDPLFRRLLFSRHHFLHGPAILLNDDAALDFAYGVQRFVDGMETITEKIWPVLLLGLITQDAYKFYHTSDDRYGNSFGQILLGRSTVEWSLSNTLGSAYPHQWLYWTTLGSLMFLPALSGWLNKKMYGNRSAINANVQKIGISKKPENAEYKLLASGEDKEREIIQKNPWRDAIRWLIPNDDLYQSMDMAEFLILWDGGINQKERIQLLENISRLADDRGSFTRLKAMAKLSNIADGFKEIDLAKFLHEEEKVEEVKAARTTATPGPKTEAAKEEARVIRRSAYDALHKHAEGPYGNLYANYLLWTLNRLGPEYSLQKDKNKLSAGNFPQPFFLFIRPLFWLAATYQLYAKYRYWQILIQKALGVISYYHKKSDCEAAGKVFIYLNQIDDYLCALCADWTQGSPGLSSIYYADADNSQSCLDAIFAKPRPPQMVLKEMQRFARSPHPSQIDLSRQNISMWTDPDWDYFFTQLERMTAQLEIFNLSHSTFTPIGPSSSQIKRFGEFIQKISPKKVDLKHQNIGPESMGELALHLRNTSIKYLDLSGNGLGDSGIRTVASVLPSMPRLNVLKIADNEITDEGASNLAEDLQKSNVTELDISGNYLEESVEILSATAEKSVLRAVDFSNMPLSVTDFRAAAPYFSYLTSFRAAGASLGAEHIAVIVPYLPLSKIQIWELPSNQLSDTGVRLLFASLRNNTAITVNINYNQVTNRGLVSIAPFIAGKLITRLDIAGNDFTLEGFAEFTQHIARSALRFISFGDNNLGEGAGKLFADALKKPTVSALEFIDFSNTRITTQDAIHLLQAITDTNITRIALANNMLSSDVILKANVSLNGLISVDFANTGIDERGAKALAKLLPHTHLSTIRLDHNPIGDAGGMELARSLVKPPIPHTEEIGYARIDGDLKRWINHNIGKNTSLVEISLSDCRLTATTARALCRLSKPAEISPKDINLHDNLIDLTDIDIENCQISAASHRAEPLLSLQVLLNSLKINLLNIGVSFLTSSVETKKIASGSIHTISTTDSQSTSKNFSSSLGLFLIVATGITLIVLLGRMMDAKEEAENRKIDRLIGYQHFGLLKIKNGETTPLDNKIHTPRKRYFSSLL